jgi:RNA polymerase sigma-70 factor (ECF subfamily)
MTSDKDEQQQVSLLRRIAVGDNAAFTQLFKHYEAEKRLWRYLYRLLNQDVDTADELFVEVMFEVWKNAASFAGKAKPSTWIFGIAHNKAMTVLRRKPWRMISLNDSDHDPREPRSLEVEEDRDRRGRCLRQAIDMLSPKHRAVVHLYLQDFSLKEMAMIIDCNEATVKTRMFYARKQLKTKLSQLGLAKHLLP